MGDGQTIIRLIPESIRIIVGAHFRKKESFHLREFVRVFRIISEVDVVFGWLRFCQFNNTARVMLREIFVGIVGEVEKLLGISSQDRIRQTIEGIVEVLDDAVE